MAVRKDLVPGDVFEFPVANGTGTALVRMILKVANLDLPTASPLSFVAGLYLFQLSRLAKLSDSAFDKNNTLVDGVFIQRDGPWKKHGFIKVGEQPITLNEVEMPCFCENQSDGRGGSLYSICRGEVRHPFTTIQGKKHTCDTIGCYVCMKTPGSLANDVKLTSRELSLNDWFWRCDMRYSESTQKLLTGVGIDLKQPYCDLLPDERKEHYLSAISS